jgi:hypothetical protein
MVGFARSTSVTGRHDGRPWRLQRANNGLLQRTPGQRSGLNPPGYLLGGFELQVHRSLRGLADTPEKGQRRLHDAAHILAPSMMLQHHS